MVLTMQNNLSPEDHDNLRKLGLITQQLALLEIQQRRWRSQQRRLVRVLVGGEVISQSRAARICEVQRQTIKSWVNTRPGEAESGHEASFPFEVENDQADIFELVEWRGTERDDI